MVKNAKQRHHNQRLLDKYSKLVSDRRKEWLSLGRVFKQDPFDCGSPNCRVCGKDSRGMNKTKQKSDLDKFYDEDYKLTELSLELDILLDDDWASTTY